MIEHGQAMVPMRSRRGYLNRLRQNTEYLMPQAMALRDVLSQSCAELGIEDLGDHALFLWNTLFDPREILDLVQTAEMLEDEVGTRLIRGLHGLLRGWATAGTGSRHRARPALGTSDPAHRNRQRSC